MFWSRAEKLSHSTQIAVFSEVPFFEFYCIVVGTIESHSQRIWVQGRCSNMSSSSLFLNRNFPGFCGHNLDFPETRGFPWLNHPFGSKAIGPMYCICTYIYHKIHKYHPNAGKYASSMNPMGNDWNDNNTLILDKNKSNPRSHPLTEKKPNQITMDLQNSGGFRFICWVVWTNRNPLNRCFLKNKGSVVWYWKRMICLGDKFLFSFFGGVAGSVDSLDSPSHLEGKMRFPDEKSKWNFG